MLIWQEQASHYVEHPDSVNLIMVDSFGKRSIFRDVIFGVKHEVCKRVEEYNIRTRMHSWHECPRRGLTYCVESDLFKDLELKLKEGSSSCGGGGK